MLTPRLLKPKEAAGYFNLPISMFERLGVGRVCFGAKVLYDKAALDAHLDTLSALTETSTPSPSEADVALERFTKHFAGSSRRSSCP